MKTLLIFVLGTMFSTVAYAGPSTSGGGIGVLCKTPNQQKLELLDLYESIAPEPPLMKSLGSFEQNYAVGLSRLRILRNDPRPVTSQDIQEALLMFKKYSEFTNENLKPTNDIGVTIALPANCHYEQVATYNDREEKLFINMDLWKQLDSLSQAALLLHESIYRMQRVAFFHDSSETRALVRQLFLENGPIFDGAYEGLKKGLGKICFAGDASTSSSFTFVWQGKEIYLLDLAGEMRFVKTVLRVPVSIDDIALERVIIGEHAIGYRVTSAPLNFEIKDQTFESRMPIPHITWRQTMKTGEIFSVGMNVHGRVLNYPVTSCFPY